MNMRNKEQQMKKIILISGLLALLFSGCTGVKNFTAVSLENSKEVKGLYKNPNPAFINGVHNIEFGGYKGKCSIYRGDGYPPTWKGRCVLKNDKETIQCSVNNSAMDGALTGGECKDKFVFMVR